MLGLKRILIVSLVAVMASMMACQSAFEKLRLSNDSTLKLEKAFEFYNKGDYLKAQYLFEDLIGLVRGGKDAERVYFHYAYTHYHLKNYTFASYYFKRFSTTFPNGMYAEEAMYMSADSYYQLSPNAKLTQEDTEDAVQGLQTFVNTYPNSGKVDTCNQMIDLLRAKLEAKALEGAKGYFHRKQYKAAKHTFGSLLVDYPDTKEVEFIRYMMVKAAYKYAQASVLFKQVERYQETITAAEKFKKRHPESAYLKEIENYLSTANNKIKKIRNEL